MTLSALRALDVPPLAGLLTPERVAAYAVHHDKLSYIFAGTGLTDAHIAVLQRVADEAGLSQRISDIMHGEKVNNGLPVTHFSMRGPGGCDDLEDVFQFVDGVRSGSILSVSGQPFEAIVQVGIGGCELGTRAAYHALRHVTHDQRYPLHFLANLDPHHIQDVLGRVPFSKTLFIIASKSGGTLETQNSLAVIERMAKEKGLSLFDNMVAVTQVGTCLDDASRFCRVFHLDPGVGGRFSVSSSVGALPLGLIFGTEMVNSFFRGAAAQDISAQQSDLRKNAALMNAMTGIWERDVLGFRAMAILPYSEPLRFFGQHLQQLICESNGKTVTLDKQPVEFPTSPLIISDVGTNVQHAVFQTLHQGSDIIPAQFICTKLSAADSWADNHKLLLASLIGQTVALAKGKQDSDPAKCFPGSRPSSIVVVDTLSAESLGALFSFYECSVIFQGLFWNINSFDQEGVELGKTLTTQAIHAPDALLNAFWEHLR
jgi:glucose-6-phosphate isomerase